MESDKTQKQQGKGKQESDSTPAGEISVIWSFINGKEGERAC